MPWIRDLKTKKILWEPTLSEKILNLIYPPSHELAYKKCLAGLLKKFFSSQVLSRIIGIFQKSTFSKKQILPFIEHYHIDTQEMLDSPKSFSSFNDFFIRKLKPDARPLGQDFVAPADGRYLFFPNISADGQWFFKGKKYTLGQLLNQDREETLKLNPSTLLAIRLCPLDYHRFHAPFEMTIQSINWLKGPLFSVNPLATHQDPAKLLENQRTCLQCHSPDYGNWYFIPIGATAVGSIQITAPINTPLKKGQELGYFEFGGSSIAMVFTHNHFVLDPEILSVRALSSACELYIPMGRTLGKAANLST